MPVSHVVRTLKYQYRVLSTRYDWWPYSTWYEHPWEAELYMLKHRIEGFVQRFPIGGNRVRGMYRVSPDAQ